MTNSQFRVASRKAKAIPTSTSTSLLLQLTLEVEDERDFSQERAFSQYSHRPPSGSCSAAVIFKPRCFRPARGSSPVRLAFAALVDLSLNAAYRRTAAGLDPYLEKSSTSLIVPASHGVPEAEVQAVWAELLLATEEEDWKALYKAGKTKWELNKAMVRVFELCGWCRADVQIRQCSGAYEATFLQSIAISSCSTRCLEIGLFTGTTTVRACHCLLGRGKVVLKTGSQLALALLPKIQSVVALDIEPLLEDYDRP